MINGLINTSTFQIIVDNTSKTLTESDLVFDILYIGIDSLSVSHSHEEIVSKINFPSYIASGIPLNKNDKFNKYTDNIKIIVTYEFIIYDTANDHDIIHIGDFTFSNNSIYNCSCIKNQNYIDSDFKFSFEYSIYKDEHITSDFDVFNLEIKTWLHLIKPKF